jgi:outer membrane protein assembly factor BamB
MLSYFIKVKGQHWPAAAFVAGNILILMVSISALAPGAHAARRLSGQEEARQLGLKRAWFAQVRLDPSSHHVENATLVGDRLSVLTSAGVLQELHGLTGATVWIAPLGNPDYPSLGPAGNEQHVAVLNGSTLYVLDRVDGRPVKIRQVGGAPGAAPAVSSKHVFAPLLTGRIEGYPLEGQILTPWYYQSLGRATVAPLTTPESFVWATDSGRVYVGRLDDLGVRYRLETGSQIIAPPAYRRPYVYVATEAGEIFAMHELTGARRWKYAAGFPVTRAPAAVEDRVFVTSEEPVLHCIDASKGIALWEAPNVAQFAALSRERVYGVDELGRLVALDAATGALVGRMATDIATHALVNDQTDRIYLVSQDGLVQCLHELDADEPLYHKPATTGDDRPAEAAGTVPAEPAPPEAATPPEPDAEEEPSPFEEETDEAEMPEEESPSGVDDENPFDF